MRDVTRDDARLRQMEWRARRPPSCEPGTGPHIRRRLRCYEPRGAMLCGSPMPRGEPIARPAEWGHPHGRFFFLLNLLVGHGVFLVRPADGTQVVSELTFDRRSGA